jgi:hypothetical protein
MGRVNLNSVRNKVKDSKKLTERIHKKVTNRFEEAKSNYIKDFLYHPVTKEISSGPEASNISNTLSGKGNLFSFIGFNKGSNPINNLTLFIRQNFFLKKEKTYISGNKIKINYKISYPNQKDLETNTPMPWEGGNSWVTAIERGISGFSHYMYKKFEESRSGSGIQTKNKIRSGSYKPTKYFSLIIDRFLKRVSNIK